MLRLALWCALVPLAAGTSVFAAWWLTRDDVWAYAGVWTMLAGAGVVALGLVLLALAAWRARPRGGLGRRRALGTLALLLMNFPAAFAYAMVAAVERSTFEVVVVNESGAPIHEIDVVREAEVVAMTDRRSLGALAPGERARARLRIGREGPIEVRYVAPEGPRSVTAIAYASPPLGERVEVRLLPGGGARLVPLPPGR